MKRILCLILCLSIIFVCLFAANTEVFAITKEGKCGDNISYSLNTSTGILELNGTGSMYDYTMPGTSPPWNAMRTYIKTLIISDGIDSIGNYAFYKLTNLTSCSIGKDIKSIGRYAFDACSSLTSINIPDGIASLSDHAFYKCENATSLTLPESIESIGEEAFELTGITNVYYPSSQTSWDAIDIDDNNPTLFNARLHLNYAYYSGQCGDDLFWELDTTDKILAISGTGDMYDFSSGDSPWHDYTDIIRGIIISDGVTSVGSYAFEDCRYSESVSLPETLLSIGDFAFLNCSSLETLLIPEGFSAFGESCLDGCSSYTDTFYIGSQDMWDLIYIAEPNDVLKGSNIICGYTEYTGTCGTGLTWTLNTGNYVLEITGNGAINNRSALPPWYSYASYIKKVKIGYGVTGIDSYSFYWCIKMNEVSIPETVKSIGPFAFQMCISLENVDLPDGLLNIEDSAFSGCRKLTTINLPDSLEYLGANAFSECAALTEISIPDKISDIFDNTFSSCPNLKTVNIGKGVSNIELEAFLGSGLTNITVSPENETYSSAGGILFNKDKDALILYCIARSDSEYTVPQGVKTISENAFYGCSAITKVNLPDSLVKIGDAAFYKCRKLSDITLPQGLTEIGKEAFYLCTALTKAVIPDSVITLNTSAYSGCSSLNSVTLGANLTTIGEYAFSECSALKSMIIPDKVSSIGKYAFYKCKELSQINIGKSVAKIGERAFFNTGLTKITVSTQNQTFADYEGNLFSKDMKTFYQYAVAKTGTEYTIPQSVTAIGDEAFYGCTTLTKINIPDCVYSIGYEAFGCCSGIKAFKLPESLKEIDGGAFTFCTSLESLDIPKGITTVSNSLCLGCSKLKNVVIPGGVTNIELAAFTDCTSLESISIPNSVEEIGVEAFLNCSSLTQIKLGSKVKKIDNNAFSSCSNLRSINLPYSLTTLGTEVFLDCTSLESISIPAQLKAIPTSAFSGCTGLKSMTMTPGTTSLGASAFLGCTSYKDTYYTGTSSQLKKTSIGSNNQKFKNASIHYIKQMTVVGLPTELIYSLSQYSGTVLIGFYNSDGILVDTNTAPCAEIVVAHTDEDYAYAEVLWWNNLNEIRPLYDVRTVEYYE